MKKVDNAYLVGSEVVIGYEKAREKQHEKDIKDFVGNMDFTVIEKLATDNDFRHAFCEILLGMDS